jgi:hypothetical protein
MAARYRTYFPHLTTGVQDKVWISGVDGAAKKKLLKKLGITHILNMSGPEVYTLASVPAEQAYHPNDFTYKVCTLASRCTIFIHTWVLGSFASPKNLKYAGKFAQNWLPWHDKLRRAMSGAHASIWVSIFFRKRCIIK